MVAVDGSLSICSPRRGWRSGGGDLVADFVFWLRRRGDACSGADAEPRSMYRSMVLALLRPQRLVLVGRSCCVGSVREVARLELGSWMEVAGSGVPRRRCRSVTTGQRSKKCGDFPRPTSHIGKCAVACGGVCFEVRNAAGLPWHFLGAGLVGGSPSSPLADATATTAAGIDGREDGGCRDPEGPFCYFSFSGVVPVSFPGELSLWFVQERGRVRCTVLVV